MGSARPGTEGCPALEGALGTLGIGSLCLQGAMGAAPMNRPWHQLLQGVLHGSSHLTSHWTKLNSSGHLYLGTRVFGAGLRIHLWLSSDVEVAFSEIRNALLHHSTRGLITVRGHTRLRGAAAAQC